MWRSERLVARYRGSVEGDIASDPDIQKILHSHVQHVHVRVHFYRIALDGDEYRVSRADGLADFPESTGRIVIEEQYGQPIEQLGTLVSQLKRTGTPNLECFAMQLAMHYPKATGKMPVVVRYCSEYDRSKLITVRLSAEEPLFVAHNEEEMLTELFADMAHF